MGHERSSTTLDLYTRRTEDGDRILRALGDDTDDLDDDAGETACCLPAAFTDPTTTKTLVSISVWSR